MVIFWDYLGVQGVAGWDRLFVRRVSRRFALDGSVLAVFGRRTRTRGSRHTPSHSLSAAFAPNFPLSPSLSLPLSVYLCVTLPVSLSLSLPCPILSCPVFVLALVTSLSRPCPVLAPPSPRPFPSLSSSV